MIPKNFVSKVLPILFLFFANQAYPYTGNTISIVRNDVTFVFSVSCDDGPCQYGQFVNGDYWVVPNTSGGIVKILSISPDGEANGAMVNPDLLRDSEGKLYSFDEQKQGVLNAYDHYMADLNLMNHLPYDASGNESIYKIKSMSNGCGTRAIEIGCVETATILTVLDVAPENDGATIFRPPFHGNWKPLYTIEKVKMDRLPSLPQVSDGTNGVIGGEYGFEDWLVPEIELYHTGLGEFHRAVIPHAAQTSYAADQALALLEDMISLFGRESEDEKRNGVYSLIQKGIDNYGVFKLGVPFSSGAGQHLGKKPPLAFFAAMYEDNDIIHEVRAISSNEAYDEVGFFQEDAQIDMGKSGMAIWGDRNGTDRAHWYFSRLYPNVDNQGSSADPYGYIDGPAGGIHPDDEQTVDRNYMPVAGGPLIGYAFLQHLMPWLKYAAGDREILLWSDRVYDGYGIDDFDGGLWTLPDPVAPRDSDESSECSPYREYSTGITNCTSYMSTWGPTEDDLSVFIAHDRDPEEYGRMPELHGYKIDFTRLPYLVINSWSELRPCSDRYDPSYPCEGLGREISLEELGVTLQSSENESSNIDVNITEEGISVTSTIPHQDWSINVYSIAGEKIKQTRGNGTELTLYWGEEFPNLVNNGVYIYRILTDHKEYSAKFIINN